ncbi:MAG TPA: hypothetical protein VFO19_04710 [Vicinamibacterales bacterium]|nr:hypothetical protein [Vicinamibacterales bacterium]
MPTITSERLTIGMLFVAIVVLACLSPVQSDTWWQLRAGEEFWRTGRVPLVDTYSWTASGRPWPNHEWLTSVIFYLAQSIGGMPLLQTIAASAIAGSMWLMWRLLRGSFEIRFLLFAACLVASTGSWAVRPQVFSMLMFALVCTLAASNRWIWIPAVIALWTNLHAASVFGVVALVGAVAATSIAHRRVDRRQLAIVVASIVATLASPLGVGLWSDVVASIGRSQTNLIIEWRPTTFMPTMWPFWAIAAAMPFALWHRRRLLDDRALILAGMALATTPLAIRAVRNVPLFLIVAVPALTAIVAAGRVERARRPVRERTGANAAILGGAAVFGLAIVALTWLRPPPSLGWQPISSDAIAAISGCRGSLYNTFEQGGVLIWFVRDRPVFLDNRQDPYPADLLAESRRVEISGDYSALFGQHDIRCAVMPPDSPTAAALAGDGRWVRAFADDRWALFQRASP